MNVVRGEGRETERKGLRERRIKARQGRRNRASDIRTVSELVTFVRFSVISVGVIKDEWLLVIQLDKKIGYILEVVDIA